MNIACPGAASVATRMSRCSPLEYSGCQAFWGPSVCGRGTEWKRKPSGQVFCTTQVPPHEGSVQVLKLPLRGFQHELALKKRRGDRPLDLGEGPQLIQLCQLAFRGPRWPSGLGHRLVTTYHSAPRRRASEFIPPKHGKCIIIIRATPPKCPVHVDIASSSLRDLQEALIRWLGTVEPWVRWSQGKKGEREVQWRSTKSGVMNDSIQCQLVAAERTDHGSRCRGSFWGISKDNPFPPN